jgi:hypothetical protein
MRPHSGAAHSRESEPLTRSLALLIVLSSIAALMLIVAGSPGSQAGSAQAPLDVVINEVAWSGTACSTYDEWIELYNNTGSPIDLNGWTLQGTIPAHGSYLLERHPVWLDTDDRSADTRNWPFPSPGELP